MSIDYTPAGPVIKRFHQSNAFVRGVMGPVGSAKSTGSVMEIMYRAMEQKPYEGFRRSRWAVLRNHYPELESTTIKTFREWLPFMPIKWSSPIVSHGTFKLPDNTTVDLEIMFLAIDRPEDIGKLKSLELTGAWINEAGEMARGVFDMVTQRVGRFPPKRWGGPSWSGVIMDTNPMDDDHWWYKLAEEEKPKSFEFFRQPPAVMEVDGKWVINPEAENLNNQPLGAEYWLRQIPGKKREWIKVFLQGNYGTVVDGKPVYPEYSDDIHCKPAEPTQGLPIVLGLDYGLTPAATFCQITPRGQFKVIDELTSEDMGIRQFAQDVLKPHIAQNYRDFEFIAVGDPAGTSRSDTDEKTCFQILAEEEINAIPAHTNAFLARREAVARFMGRLIDGQPGFMMDPKCRMLRKGFNGGYAYKRVNVGGERYRDVPDKNSSSHPQDALQYAALYATLETVNTASFKKKIQYRSLGIV